MAGINNKIRITIKLFRNKDTEELSLLYPVVAKFYEIDSHQTCGFLDLESMNCKRAELDYVIYLFCN